MAELKDEKKELLEKIKQIDNWDWYLDQKPNMLSQELKDKFDIKVSSAKLRGLRRTIKETKHTKESSFLA